MSIKQAKLIVICLDMFFNAALRLNGIDISLVGSTVRKGKFVAEHLLFLLLLLLLLINGVFYSTVFMGSFAFLLHTHHHPGSPSIFLPV